MACARLTPGVPYSSNPGAIVKLSRPGVFEAEPSRWQVLDATHIRAIFDTRLFPLGLYDVTVTNPAGSSAPTQADQYTYMVTPVTLQDFNVK